MVYHLNLNGKIILQYYYYNSYNIIQKKTFSAVLLDVQRYCLSGKIPFIIPVGPCNTFVETVYNSVYNYRII